MKTALQKFCEEEVAYRALESGRLINDDQKEKLAKRLYETSESWIDSEKICEIVDDFLREQ